MYRAGTINAKTFVCLEGSQAWKEVSAIEHKFATAVASPTGQPTNATGPDNPAKKIKPGTCCLNLVLFLLALGFLFWVLFFQSTNEPTITTVSTPSPPPTVAPSSNDQAAAAAEQKEDEERRAGQQQEEADSQKDAATFKKLVGSIDSNSTIVSSVSVGSGVESDQLTIVVANVWHSQPYQDRLQLAQAFLKLWISIHSPDHPNESRISITDLMENEVGGSSMWSGACVQKD